MGSVVAFKTKSEQDASPEYRQAIIDIGSNSVRIVAYAGARRAPSVIFNEKVMAGLGRSLSSTGRIDDEAMARSIRALERFAALAKTMEIDDLRCVATAAVRDADNGQDIIDAAARIGLTVELLSGEQEAEAAGYGVIAAIPEADGIAADLGGGSLELVRIKDGKTWDKVSFQLGVLRLAGIRAGIKDPKKAREEVAKHIRKTLRNAKWLEDVEDLPLYLVGGSWRSLARLEMEEDDHPLPIMHYHEMPAKAAGRIVEILGDLSVDDLRNIQGLSGQRIPTLHDAATLLQTLVKELKVSRLIVSSTGLREGLLYQKLPETIRQEDPLLAAAREEGQRLARFPEHGKLLDKWISPLFPDDDAAGERLRLAACLLSDVAWTATPDFRAERGLEIALHGDWLGIDIGGRIIMGQALFSCFGGGADMFDGVHIKVATQQLRRAALWGLAMRLGQRLSAGVAEPLTETRLQRDGDIIRLLLPNGASSLYGEAVERRLRQLATAMGCRYEMIASL